MPRKHRGHKTDKRQALKTQFEAGRGDFFLRSFFAGFFFVTLTFFRLRSTLFFSLLPFPPLPAPPPARGGPRTRSSVRRNFIKAEYDNFLTEIRPSPPSKA